MRKKLTKVLRAAMRVFLFLVAAVILIGVLLVRPDPRLALERPMPDPPVELPIPVWLRVVTFSTVAVVFGLGLRSMGFRLPGLRRSRERARDDDDGA